MEVINLPFTKIEDDDTCVLLKPALKSQPPVTAVVDEIMKVLNLYPEARERVKLRLSVGK